MSISQAAILFYGKLPALQDVQRLALDLGYDFRFRDYPDLRSHSGELIANFENSEAMFDVRLEAADAFDWMPDDLDRCGDAVLALTTAGGDFKTGLAATIFLRAFCELADAAWWYMDHDDVFQLPGTTNAYFDEQIADYRVHIAKLAQVPAARSAQPVSPGFSNRLKKWFSW